MKLTLNQLATALTEEQVNEIFRMAEVDGWCWHDLSIDAVRAIAARTLMMHRPSDRIKVVKLQMERDPDVELRGLVKELLKVMVCHHRNTHKPLIERLRQLRNSL